MALPKDIDARKFARVAMRRLDEAKVIHEKVRLSAAAQYLSGYAVECIMKALVIVTTPLNERPAPGEETIEWVKTRFGHDLEGLRSHLAKHGAKMSREVAGEFVFVSTWDPQLRYEPGPGDPEKTERFLTAAEKILKWADERM